MTKYDYIFTGAGAAGLSLLTRLIRTGKFNDKQILVVDSSPKKSNDRTWCFWEKQNGFFDEVVYKRFPKLWYHSKNYSALNDISPYTYKLLRGIDFYEHCFELINSQPNITFRQDAVTGAHSFEGRTWINIGTEEIDADFIFNSIIFEKPVLKSDQFYMLQHFKGWVIECDRPIFNEEEATLMDFRVSQQPGTCFVYLMPFSKNTALVEYTVFGKAIFDDESYEKELKHYIDTYLHMPNYTIQHTENGVIPMTNYSYPLFEGNIVNLGTAGGQTKASSGYTFQFIQKQSDKILEALLQTERPFYEENIFDKRFALYDSTLLNILYNNKLQGAEIFTTLFQRNKMTEILKFLDNETNLAEEMKLLTVLPTKQFLQAAWQELF